MQIYKNGMEFQNCKEFLFVFGFFGGVLEMWLVGGGHLDAAPFNYIAHFDRPAYLQQVNLPVIGR